MLDIFSQVATLIFIYMSVLFLIAMLKKDYGIVDIAWGIGFILVAWLCYDLTQEVSARKLLINFMVTIWGSRLAIYLFLRNKGKEEDFRYKNWRRDWGNTFVWRSFLQVFMLQGFFMFIVSLPVMMTNFSSSPTLHGPDFLALFLFIFGFYFEAVSDYQLYQFKKNPANKGKIMTEGLWQYSRHPNYFGEMMIWWGIFILSLHAVYPYVSIISPIVMTWLLTRVSGVPMLEAKYKKNPEYKKYAEETSAFVPRFW